MILHYAFDSYIVAQIYLYCKAFCNKTSGLFADCFHASVRWVMVVASAKKPLNFLYISQQILTTVFAAIIEIIIIRSKSALRLIRR